MIERLPDRADLAEFREQPGAIVELHRSINENLMSAESYPTQHSEATIVITRDSQGVKLFVHYHLYDDDVGLLYQETDPITRDNFAMIRDMAIQSVEAMGFILERIDVRSLPEQDRLDLLARLPAFGGRGRQIGNLPGDSTVQGTSAGETAADESVFLLEDTVDEASTSSVEMPLPGGVSVAGAAGMQFEPEIWDVFLRMAASL